MDVCPCKAGNFSSSELRKKAEIRLLKRSHSNSFSFQKSSALCSGFCLSHIQH